MDLKAFSKLSINKTGADPVHKQKSPCDNVDISEMREIAQQFKMEPAPAVKVPVRNVTDSKMKKWSTDPYAAKNNLLNKIRNQ